MFVKTGDPMPITAVIEPTKEIEKDTEKKIAELVDEIKKKEVILEDKKN